MEVPARTIGRYLMSGPIAVGGMASVHLGKLNGPVGFRRTVAIKRMLQTWSSNPRSRAMLIDEARLAARVSHANVVQTLDVVEHEDELFLILEYVEGQTLDHLLERVREGSGRAPRAVVIAILGGVLRGLHAAHEARGEDGQPLELVHRDLSPHNIIVDVHGVTRVLDFGVARARGRLQATQDDALKGKLSYLAPEQVHGETSRRSDLFTAGVVLWECLAGRQLFEGNSEADLLSKVLLCKVPTLESLGAGDPPLQAILDQVLDRDPERRFSSAGQMAEALEACGAAGASEVGAWVRGLAADTLADRARVLEVLERAPIAATAVPPPKSGRTRQWLAGAVLAAVAGLAVAWGARAPAPVQLEPAGKLALPVKPVVVEAPPLPPAPPAPPAPAPAPTPVVVKKPSPPPAPACNPPFVIDAAGVKRFKVECLR